MRETYTIDLEDAPELAGAVRDLVEEIKSARALSSPSGRRLTQPERRKVLKAAWGVVQAVADLVD